MLHVLPSLRDPAWPDHAEEHVIVTAHHRKLHIVTTRAHHSLARRKERLPTENSVRSYRRHRPARRHCDALMRWSEHRTATQRLHLQYQTQPAPPAAPRHPATLLVGVGGDPLARCLLYDRPRLCLLGCCGCCGAAAGSAAAGHSAAAAVARGGEVEALGRGAAGEREPQQVGGS